jgi:hypothetical protein
LAQGKAHAVVLAKVEESMAGTMVDGVKALSNGMGVLRQDVLSGMAGVRVDGEVQENRLTALETRVGEAIATRVRTLEAEMGQFRQEVLVGLSVWRGRWSYPRVQG